MLPPRQCLSIGALLSFLSRLSPWTWLVLFWALCSTALWLSQILFTPLTPLFALLDWQPGLWISQPWRLWTAALVHWSGAHLLLNLLACAVLLAWGNAARLGRCATGAWLLAWPLTQGLLALSPQWGHFGGLSGVLHAGVAIGAWALLRRGPAPLRRVGAWVLVGLGFKLVFECSWLAPWLGWPILELPLAGAPGFTVASVAHLTGAVSGLACAMAVDFALAPTNLARGKRQGRVQRSGV